MRKIISVAGVVAMLFTFSGFQIVTNSCSRQLVPDGVNLNSHNQAEKEKQKETIVPGTGKKITTQRPRADDLIKTAQTSADDIIKTAEEYIGVPHCMGGTTMKCIDCSGLLVTVFGQHGIKLPHNSEEQSKFGKIIRNPGELVKGDLVFFIGTYNTSRLITHSGIYLGNYEFIHTSSAKGVTITSINNPLWNKKFNYGTSILNN
jgi:cell wall-associated NlpC family hydrolase